MIIKQLFGIQNIGGEQINILDAENQSELVDQICAIVSPELAERLRAAVAREITEEPPVPSR